MKRSRTGSSAEKVLPLPSVVSVRLPLIDGLADMKTSFFGLCLTAGQPVFQAMMEQDREQLCGLPSLSGDPRQLGVRHRQDAASDDGPSVTVPSFVLTIGSRDIV